MPKQQTNPVTNILSCYEMFMGKNTIVITLIQLCRHQCQKHKRNKVLTDVIASLNRHLSATVPPKSKVMLKPLKKCICDFNLTHYLQSRKLPMVSLVLERANIWGWLWKRLIHLKLYILWTESYFENQQNFLKGPNYHPNLNSIHSTDFSSGFQTGIS